MEKKMSANHARKWQETFETATQPAKQVKVKVHRQGWITKGEKVLYSLAAACVFGAGLFTVNHASATDSINRQLQNAEKQVKQQKSANNDLTYEIKELSRPERITKIAKQNGLKIQDAEVKQVDPVGR